MLGTSQRPGFTCHSGSTTIKKPTSSCQQLADWTPCAVQETLQNSALEIGDAALQSLLDQAGLGQRAADWGGSSRRSAPPLGCCGETNSFRF